MSFLVIEKDDGPVGDVVLCTRSSPCISLVDIQCNAIRKNRVDCLNLYFTTPGTRIADVLSPFEPCPGSRDWVGVVQDDISRFDASVGGLAMFKIPIAYPSSKHIVVEVKIGEKSVDSSANRQEEAISSRSEISQGEV